MDKDLQTLAENRLHQHYPEERVVRQPDIPISVLPDFGVRTADNQGYLLLVKCSSMRTRHRRQEDLSLLKRMMEKGEADYGALISDEVEYIFELTEFDGEVVERELPEYPEGVEDEFDDVLSESEIQFRCWRALDRLRGSVPDREYHYHLFHGLFRKLVASKKEIAFTVDSIDEEWLTEIDTIIADEYPSYTPEAAPNDVEVQRQIFQSFEGVKVENIQPRAARAFTHLIESSREAPESMTPLRISDAIVDLAGPTDGDWVLDPAAGVGNMVREAELRGAEVSAVEIDPKIVNSALFLNAVHDADIDYIVLDFLDAAIQDSSNLPEDLDHILMDPPFGLHYERPDGTTERNAEEMFISESLRRLRAGGVVTAVITQGSLYKQRSKEFREKITNEYRLATIIEINKPIFPHTAVPTAIIQIVNEPAHENSEVQYQVVEGSDAEGDLDRAVQAIHNDDAPTIQFADLYGSSFIPSEVVGIERVTERLREQYENVEEIKECADEVRTGIRISEPNSDPGVDRYPLLRPKDVGAGKEEKFVSRDDASVTAGPSDVLLSVKGKNSVVHVPNTEIVPSSDWAIMRFNSPDDALVYATFLESELGQEQLEMIRSGAAIPYIPLRRLREVLLPVFSKTEITEKAEQIRSLRSEVQEYERQRDEIENAIKDVIGGE